ncbi:hypothetical protein D9M68_885050 [compost metagenome]
MLGIEIAHVTPSDRLHHQRHPVRRLGCEQQVEMVVHQHPGVQRHLVLAGVFPDQVEQHAPVRIVQHDGLAVVASLNDVVRVTGQGQAGKTGHVERSRQ